MSVEDFIKELLKYPNQKAELNFVVNLINPMDESFDVNNCKVELFQQDIEDIEIYDVMIFQENK